MESRNICIYFGLVFLLITSGCASRPESEHASSCAKLVHDKRVILKEMVDKAKRNKTFERHVVVLETGNELSDSCKTQHIDKKTFDGIPGSLKELCKEQQKPGHKYCSLFQLDGKPDTRRVY